MEDDDTCNSQHSLHVEHRPGITAPRLAKQGITTFSGPPSPEFGPFGCSNRPGARIMRKAQIIWALKLFECSNHSDAQTEGV